jgi:hypothetical protein
MEASKKREATDTLPNTSATKKPKNDTIDADLNYLLQKDWKSPVPLSAVKYSPNGLYLACACIFSTPLD